MANDDDDNEVEGEECPLSYEQWGAPVLLYRNRNSYTQQDDTPMMMPSSKSILDTFVRDETQMKRAMARWYYQHQFPFRTDDDRENDDDLMYVSQCFDSTNNLSLFRETAKKRRKDRALMWKKIEENKNGNGHDGDNGRRKEDDRDRDGNESSSSSSDSGSNQKRRGTTQRNKRQSESKRQKRNDDNLSSDYDSEDESSDDESDGTASLQSSEIDQVVNRRVTNYKLPVSRRLERKEHLQNRMKREMMLNEQLKDPNLVGHNADPDVQIDRAEMLLAEQRHGDDETIERAKKKLLVMTQFDANYIPAMDVTKGYIGFRGGDVEQQRMYDRERLTRGDPAYLAPIPGALLSDMLKEETRLYDNRLQTKLQVIRSLDSPKLYGNCLVSFPCRCDSCKKKPKGASPCLLHPVGPLRSTVRFSFCWLPHKHVINYHLSPPPSIKGFARKSIDTIQADFDMGDRIVQITKCGGECTFLVRTTLHLTMIRIKFVLVPGRVPIKGACWGSAYIDQLHRWDHRALSPSDLSYHPVSITSHPRFGSLTPSNVVAVYRASNGRQNYLHHIHATASGDTVQQHVVQNLAEISQVDFSAAHPMVLWAAARSFVHPLMGEGGAKKESRPRVGNGLALYNIDLRCSQKATFQWSPSGEEYYPEGIQTISGISTDWSFAHRMWISSFSAGRTWELDNRMPCRCVTAYSLPYFSDQQPSVQALAEVSGSGAMFSYPWSSVASPNSSSDDDNDDNSDPVLCMGKNPGTFGFHMYHRPQRTSLFRTRSVECYTGSFCSGMDDFSVARSAIFPLPTCSPTIFPIGLTSFHVGLERFGDRKAIDPENELIDTALCIVSLTSKGDLHLHILLGSHAPSRRGKHYPGLPGGSSVVPVPEACLVTHRPDRNTQATKSRSSWNELCFKPTNDMPVPGEAVDSLVATPKDNTVQINHLIRKNSARFPTPAEMKPRDEHLDEDELDEKPPLAKSIVSGGDGKMGVLVPTETSLEEAPISLRYFPPESNPPSEFLDKQSAVVEGYPQGPARSDLHRDALENAWRMDSSSSSPSSSEDGSSQDESSANELPQAVLSQFAGYDSADNEDDE